MHFFEATVAKSFLPGNEITSLKEQTNGFHNWHSNLSVEEVFDLHFHDGGGVYCPSHYVPFSLLLLPKVRDPGRFLLHTYTHMVRSWFMAGHKSSCSFLYPCQRPLASSGATLNSELEVQRTPFHLIPKVIYAQLTHMKVHMCETHIHRPGYISQGQSSSM